MGFVVMLDELGEDCVREGVLFCVWPVVFTHLFSVVTHVKRTLKGMTNVRLSHVFLTTYS
jgi:hypothetical protein